MIDFRLGYDLIHSNERRKRRAAELSASIEVWRWMKTDTRLVIREMLLKEGLKDGTQAILVYLHSGAKGIIFKLKCLMKPDPFEIFKCQRRNWKARNDMKNCDVIIFLSKWHVIEIWIISSLSSVISEVWIICWSALYTGIINSQLNVP